MSAAFLFALVLAAPPASPVSAQRLESGLEVIEIDRGLGQLMHFRLALRLGSAFDPPGKAGLARVATILIASGIGEMSPSSEPRVLERLGVEIEAETGVTSAVFFGSMPIESADRAMPMIIEAIVHPPSSETAAKNAIARALDERQRLLADDRALAEREMKRMLFRAHPLGRSPRGDVREIASISADDVQALLKRQLHADSIALAVAPKGMADHAKKWTDAFAHGHAAADLDNSPGPDRTHGRRIVLVDKPERRTAEVSVGALVPGATDPRRAAIHAALAAIGGSLSSRLIAELDTKQRVASTPIARLDSERSASALEITFSADPAKLPQALRALFDELSAIEKKGLSETDIRFGRSYAASRAVLEVRDPVRALRAVVGSRIVGLEVSEPWAIAKVIEECRDDEVRAGARLVAVPEDLAIAIVASITPRLQAELASLPGVKSVEIVSWEDR